MKFGGYQTTERIGGRGLSSVYQATSPDHPAQTFAIKVEEHDDGGEEDAQALGFLSAARLQAQLGEAQDRQGRPLWAPIHAWGVAGTNPYYVTTYYAHSARSLIDGRTRLRGPALAAIMGGVVHALHLIWDQHHRGHGRLASGNVLLTSLGQGGQWHAVLTDPAPVAQPDASEGLRLDLQALGMLLDQLVTHARDLPEPGSVALMGPAWQALGRRGPAWLELRNLLLSNNVAEHITVESLAARLPAAPPSGTRRRWPLPLAASLALVALLAAGGWWWRQRQPPTVVPAELAALQQTYANDCAEAETLARTWEQEGRWPQLAAGLRRRLGDLKPDGQLSHKFQQLRLELPQFESLEQQWQHAAFRTPLVDCDEPQNKRFLAHAKAVTRDCSSVDAITVQLNTLHEQATSLAARWKEELALGQLELAAFAAYESDAAHGLWAAQDANKTDFRGWYDAWAAALPRFHRLTTPDPRDLPDREAREAEVRKLEQQQDQDLADQAPPAKADAQARAKAILANLAPVTKLRLDLAAEKGARPWVPHYEPDISQRVAEYGKRLKAVEDQASEWRAAYVLTPAQWLEQQRRADRSAIAGASAAFSARWCRQRDALLPQASSGLPAEAAAFKQLKQQVDAWWTAFNQVQQQLPLLPKDVRDELKTVLADSRADALQQAASLLEVTPTPLPADWVKAAAALPAGDGLKQQLDFATTSEALYAAAAQYGLPEDKEAPEHYDAKAWERWRQAVAAPTPGLAPVLATNVVRCLQDFDAVVHEAKADRLLAIASDATAWLPCQVAATLRLAAHLPGTDGDYQRQEQVRQRVQALLDSNKMLDPKWRIHLLAQLRQATLRSQAHLVTATTKDSDVFLRGLEAEVLRQQAKPEKDLEQVVGDIYRATQEIAAGNRYDYDLLRARHGQAAPPGLAPYAQWLKDLQDCRLLVPDPRQKLSAGVGKLRDQLNAPGFPAADKAALEKRWMALQLDVNALYSNSKYRPVAQNQALLGKQVDTLDAALAQLVADVAKAAPAK